jgi:hypothetical protein
MKRVKTSIVALLVGFTVTFSLGIADSQAIDEEVLDALEFKLMGVEVIKGFDFGDIRYGTKFTGKIFEGSDDLGYSDVGYWWTTICHTDTENIEVCDGTNNLLRFRLVVIFTDGSFDGHRLYLKLKEPGLVEDVYWDSIAPMCGPAYQDPDCVCPNNPDDIQPWDCSDQTMPEGYGPVATIPELELKRRFGTTLNFTKASLTGWLCHNWLFVPRVLGYLTLEIED